mmetsp:Transcript_6915/g.24214  ORF Transcript_6915/g.24214 Transcript_6915/m.24214 type:complete len:81 (-) Transcript_6915:408-650(-)
MTFNIPNIIILSPIFKEFLKFGIKALSKNKNLFFLKSSLINLILVNVISKIFFFLKKNLREEQLFLIQTNGVSKIVELKL